MKKDKNHIITQRKGFYVSPVNRSIDKIELYKLRNEVFSKELNWVPDSIEKLEVDKYDMQSKHLGLFNPEGDLIGTVRLISSSNKWMIEECFAKLVPAEQKLDKQNTTAEISRLAIDKTRRSHKIDSETYPIDLLLQGLFLYSAYQNLSKFYMVVSNIVFKLLTKRGIPCKKIGNARKMEDGVVAVAAELDILHLLFYNTAPSNHWHINQLDREIRMGEGNLKERVLNVNYTNWSSEFPKIA